MPWLSSTARRWSSACWMDLRTWLQLGSSRVYRKDNAQTRWVYVCIYQHIKNTHIINCIWHFFLPHNTNTKPNDNLRITYVNWISHTITHYWVGIHGWSLPGLCLQGLFGLFGAISFWTLFSLCFHFTDISETRATGAKIQTYLVYNRGGHTGPRKKIQLFWGSNPNGSWVGPKSATAAL